ncbi:hypothetical protein FZEAL_4245 [Fusarium zealandicum]|uniref:Uncharacterized protein n=1 Tax=Fusarium zealandicum TaxID=1053134 RepID=A0A8H4UM19_9HYPO|nr:hypothetical protein FZEAL_4245 [Fusarium zealandicum]
MSSNANTTSNSESCDQGLSMASFYFPDAHTAISFFNNDLASAPYYSIRGDDGCYATEEVGSSYGGQIPSSYMSTFQAEKRTPSPPSLTTSGTLSLDDWASYNSGNSRSDRSEQDVPSRPPTPNLRRQSTMLAEITHDDVPPLTLPEPKTKPCTHQGLPLSLHPESRRAYGVLPVEAANEPALPAYHVHQLDWENAVDIWELSKKSKQLEQEIKTLDWDSNHPFESHHKTGSPEYRREHAVWRDLRRKRIDCDPTSKQQAQSDQVFFRLFEIKANRAEGRIVGGQQDLFWYK